MCKLKICLFTTDSIAIGLPQWPSSKKSAYNAGEACLIPGCGRSPGGGNDNPLQCSCLENPRDGVAQSRTRLK